MKKILFLIAIALCCRLLSFAQATSLTVDCQTPGWLSSKINYSDQLTVENMTITGFINSDDLKFIGSLMNNQNLSGVIDLTDVEIVPDNSLGTNAFGVSGTYGSIEIKKLLLPLSLKKAYQTLPTIMRIDTLVLGGQNMHIIDRDLFELGPYSYSNGPDIVSTFIFREGVDSIADYALSGRRVENYTSGISTDPPLLKKAVFPSTFKYIGLGAFQYCLNMKDIEFPDGVEEIGDYAFFETGYMPDTLFLPRNLKTYYVMSFPVRTNQIVYLSENIEKLFGTTTGANYKIFDEIHIARKTPPELGEPTWWKTYQKNTLVYVPKGSKTYYTNDNNWSWATIIEEEILADSIYLNQNNLNLRVGENAQLFATISPDNAEKTVKWLSSNVNVATVNSTGVVTATGKGDAIITASTTDGTNLTAQCSVLVTQPVESVALDNHNINLNAGASEQLFANVSPTTASNKKLIWSSNNTQIATVDEDGNVTGVKAGTTFIKAVSEDNPEAADSCKVTVLQPVTGIKLDKSSLELYGIGATAQLVATVEPADASNQQVKWASSNESVCIVSNGTVVALGYGISVIIATTVDGNYIATCTVTVKEGSPGIPGDITGDGTVDIADVNAVINMMLGKAEQTAAGDVTGDGTVDIADVNAVINIMLGKE